MILIIGLILITLFYLVTAKAIKKMPVLFYLGTYLIQALVIGYYAFKCNEQMPKWFNTYIMEFFKRGMFSTVTFIIVMYLGVFIKHNFVSKRLMQIRGELSIIGCFSIICHNIIFGVVYFPSLIEHPKMMTWRTLSASILTVILLLMMIPMFITSFKCVRKRMKAKSWKNIQRMAYPFFIGIYIHVMILFSANVSKFKTSIIIYSIIFGLYVVLRIRKAIVKSMKKKALQV